MLTADESREEALLQTILQQSYPRRAVRDSLLWGQEGRFSVRSLYSKALSIKCSGTNVDRLICAVWKKLAPPPQKVELMVWLALMGKLNTKDMLARKGMITEDLSACTFCNEQNEDSHHLRVSYQVSWNIWKTIAADFGQAIEPCTDLKEFYGNWLRRRLPNKTARKLWIASFFATIWSLWMHRNEIVFNQQYLDEQMLGQLIKWRVAFWSRAWDDHIPYSTEMLARNFHSIPLLFR